MAGVSSGKESTGSWSAGSGAEILFGSGTYSLGSTVPLSGIVKVITATVTAGKIEAPAASLSIETEGCCLPGTVEITARREYNEDSQETSTVSPRGKVTGGEPLKFTTKIKRLEHQEVRCGQ